MLLEQLRAEMPEAERAYATENPQALARLATRAEVREPGTMERLFSRVPAAGPGFGGMMAGSLLGSMAGTVLGTMLAQIFRELMGCPKAIRVRVSRQTTLTTALSPATPASIPATPRAVSTTSVRTSTAARSTSDDRKQRSAR